MRVDILRISRVFFIDGLLLLYDFRLLLEENDPLLVNLLEHLKLLQLLLDSEIRLMNPPEFLCDFRGLSISVYVGYLAN